MPRRTRRFEAGVLYHLIPRFVAGEWFIRDDSDRRLYLGLFGRALLQSDWTSIGYAVMNNHLHHAVIAGKAPLSSWLRGAHGEFAERINARHGRIGAVFVRGPKAIGVQDEGAAKLVGYIHRNPVRAGVVSSAGQSTWTSHRDYLRPDRAPEWLDVPRGLKLMRFEDANLMDAWIDASPVVREELDTFRTEPFRRRGRRPMPEKAKPA